LANWTPEGFVGTYFRTVTQYVPPPPGLKPPVLWGTEERLRELFGDNLTSLHITRRSVMARSRSPQHWLEIFRTYFGPTVKAFEVLDAAGQEHLAQDLVSILYRFNRSGDETLVLPSDYVEVVAIKCRTDV
jgi:hypothetical protein